MERRLERVGVSRRTAAPCEVLERHLADDRMRRTHAMKKTTITVELPEVERARAEGETP